MSENFAEMLANEEWKEIHTGEVVDGTVIAVKEDHICLLYTSYSYLRLYTIIPACFQQRQVLS